VNQPPPNSSAVPDPPTWAVYRIDDNGNRFVVRTGLDRDAARRLASEFEARGHKQTYWTEEEPS
jgi:hypothetical protein